MLQLMAAAVYRYVVLPSCNARPADTTCEKLPNRFPKGNVRSQPVSSGDRHISKSTTLSSSYPTTLQGAFSAPTNIVQLHTKLLTPRITTIRQNATGAWVKNEHKPATHLPPYII